jgi:hypothetical protein
MICFIKSCFFLNLWLISVLEQEQNIVTSPDPQNNAAPTLQYCPLIVRPKWGRNRTKKVLYK